jgi:hypothetical protein
VLRCFSASGENLDEERQVATTLFLERESRRACVPPSSAAEKATGWPAVWSEEGRCGGLGEGESSRGDEARVLGEVSTVALRLFGDHRRVWGSLDEADGPHSLSEARERVFLLSDDRSVSG